MNCEIISNIKPEVTSPIPSCRRGTITTQGHAHIQSSPYRGSQRGSQGRGTITTQGHAHIQSSPYRGSQRGAQGRWDDYHARDSAFM